MLRVRMIVFRVGILVRKGAALRNVGADERYCGCLGVFKLLNSAAHILGYSMATAPATTQLWVNIAVYALGAALSAVVVGRLRAPSCVRVGVEGDRRRLPA